MELSPHSGTWRRDNFVLGSSLEHQLYWTGDCCTHALTAQVGQHKILLLHNYLLLHVALNLISYWSVQYLKIWRTLSIIKFSFDLQVEDTRGNMAQCMAGIQEIRRTEERKHSVMISVIVVITITLLGVIISAMVIIFLIRYVVCGYL